MKFEKTDVWGFEHAIRGMRNPKESWSKSDSFNCDSEHCNEKCRNFDADENECPQFMGYHIGENDMKLMQTLIKAGSEHRKFMRQVFVSVDITAPLYWWKEFDTYKVGTVANSTSTMHKLASKPITMECFEMGDFQNFITNNQPTMRQHWEKLIDLLNALRAAYNVTKDKRYWKELIRLLPESWLQTRTVTMSYENIYTMVRQRKNHKLSEWAVDFIDWAHTLPYADELLFLEDKA